MTTDQWLKDHSPYNKKPVDAQLYWIGGAYAVLISFLMCGAVYMVTASVASVVQ